MAGKESAEEEVRIVLIGHTGSGKSATGNSILGSKNFESTVCASGVTTKCEIRSARRFGRDIHIVDTPGLFDPAVPNETVLKEIDKCIAMTAPGPHAFILVLKIGRFSPEEQNTVEEIKEYFGEDVEKYLFVLFTRLDELKGKPFEDYLKTVPEKFKELMQNCKDRFIAVNNEAPDEEKNKDVQRLLEMVEENLKKNNAKHYTNEMYQEAENAMK